MAFIIKNVRLLVLIIMFSFSLTACNTIEGIGEDIGAAGSTIEKSAKKNKKY